PDAVGADERERRVEHRLADEERIVLRPEILAIGEIERDAVRGADRREMAPFRTSLQIENVGKKFGGGPSVPRREDRVIEFDAHLCPPVWCALRHLLCESRQVIARIAEAVLDKHAAAEIMADRVFLCHADAAMQLYSVLRH